MKRLIILAILAMAVSVDAATLKWEASTGDVTQYKVYTTYDETKSKLVGDVTEIDTSILNLSPGVTYTIQVSAINCFGESGLSNTVEFTAPCFIPTEDPRILTINLPNNVTVTVE